ncbi:unnamed protein product, partial [Vitrella brassicaformis CCMP3155]
GHLGHYRETVPTDAIKALSNEALISLADDTGLLEGFLRLTS